MGNDFSDAAPTSGDDTSRTDSCGEHAAPCPTCDDGIQNGKELRIDCGGGACPPCAVCEAPFGPPESISGLGLAGPLAGPALTSDGLTLFISEVNGSRADIHTAERTDRGTVFSEASPVSELNSPYFDGGPSLTLDGLTLYFYSTRSHPDIQDLWSAVRTHPTAKFQEPVMLFWVNSDSNDALPTLTHDEAFFMFASDRPEGEGGYDIWISRRSTRGDYYEIPTNLIELNTSENETAPAISGDGLTLFYVTDRSGGAGDFDIWTASRPDGSASFEAPTPVAGVNSADAETDVFLSADERELVFISTRNGEAALFRAWRECP